MFLSCLFFFVLKSPFIVHLQSSNELIFRNNLNKIFFTNCIWKLLLFKYNVFIYFGHFRKVFIFLEIFIFLFFLDWKFQIFSFKYLYVLWKFKLAFFGNFLFWSFLFCWKFSFSLWKVLFFWKF